MSSFEYTVIPAPARGDKAKGARTGIERFATTLGETLNEMAREGWEYVRAETLPCEERAGLTGRTTTYHNLLIFRRSLAAAMQPAVPFSSAEPAEPAEPEPEPPAATGAARGPFSQPMRATPRPEPASPAPGQMRARMAEPPLTAPPAPAPSGPRLGPANR
ncbi:DUF4177 domain-containing protein [Paracoccus sp. (in: a-proteobacteria)]|uniref:DUF4177 domain-containing protein n=1 Tax=Paracoccus sp. TaxID=267 RepID=UPI00321FB52D